MDLAISEASAIAKQLAADIAAAYEPPVTGRPAKLGDPETLAEFFRAVEAGNYLETAAELAGISTETLRQWSKRGEEGEEPFNAFLAATKRLSRRAEALMVEKVTAAAHDPRFWAAGMTYLERRHPERWARRSEDSSAPKVLVQIGVGQGDVRVLVQGQSPELPAPGAPMPLTAGEATEE